MAVGPVPVDLERDCPHQTWHRRGWQELSTVVPDPQKENRWEAVPEREGGFLTPIYKEKTYDGK